MSEREIQLLESAFLFSLIWSTVNFIKPQYYTQFTTFILEQATKYRTDIKPYYIEEFGFNFLYTLSKDPKLTIFDIGFDLKNEKWVKWENLDISNKAIFSNKLDEVMYIYIHNNIFYTLKKKNFTFKKIN